MDEYKYLVSYVFENADKIAALGVIAVGMGVSLLLAGRDVYQNRDKKTDKYSGLARRVLINTSDREFTLPQER